MILALLLACTDPPDVVVIGGGPAGLAAAIEAGAGADVIVIEAGHQLGGSATLAFGATALPETWPGNPASERYAARVRPDVIAWTEGLGLSWTTAPNPAHDGVEIVAPSGGGGALAGVLEAEARRYATVRLNTRATGLRLDPLAVQLDNGEWLAADAIIIATGGFVANAPKVRQLLGLPSPPLRGGPRWADGGGLDLGTAVGGVVRTPGRAMLYGHGTPDPAEPTKALMLLPADATWPVAEDGAFLPEVQSARGGSGDLLVGKRGWAVIDGQGLGRLSLWDVDGPKFRKAERIAKKNTRHETLAGLAVALGLPAGTFDAAPLKPGNGFWAFPIASTAAKSLTGLETDLDGHVLDATGAPVPGVFAAGEVAGFGHPYAATTLDSTMVAGAILTGRAAGQAAVRDLRSQGGRR